MIELNEDALTHKYLALCTDVKIFALLLFLRCSIFKTQFGTEKHEGICK